MTEDTPNVQEIFDTAVDANAVVKAVMSRLIPEIGSGKIDSVSVADKLGKANGSSANAAGVGSGHSSDTLEEECVH